MRRRQAVLLVLLLGGSIACAPPNAAAQTAAPITVGADRLFTEFAHLIRGKKLALVTNHSARLADGTHLADALHRYPEAELKVLFGMEYNIRSNDYSGARDAESSIDPETGLAKYSLYGDRHKPTR